MFGTEVDSSGRTMIFPVSLLICTPSLSRPRTLVSGARPKNQKKEATQGWILHKELNGNESNDPLYKPPREWDFGLNHWRNHQATYDLLDQYLIWHTLGSNFSVQSCEEGPICQRISISLEFLHPRPPKVSFLTLPGGQLNDAVDTESL